MEESATPMMVGKIIMPSKSEAVSMELPLPPRCSRTIGTITVRPKKP